jgi:hypothetical protein
LIWIKTSPTGASKIAASSEDTGVLEGLGGFDRTEPLQSAPVLAAVELSEELAQWVEEADGGQREALENVLGHI